MSPWNKPWKEYSYVAFDTETSGQYPISSEICEIGAIRYENGVMVDKFQTLVQVSKPMTDFIIGIHGITNEMLVGAPTMDQVLPQFLKFIDGAIVMAHHAPFDLGFIAFELEKRKWKLPTLPAICTSLLSRRVVYEAPNHKLQTLIQTLGLHKGVAHRALDDTQACLELALNCMTRVGAEAPLSKIFDSQGGVIEWQRFSLEDLKRNPIYAALIEGSLRGSPVDMVYSGGSRPGQVRRVQPQGVVRSLDNDFLVGVEPGEEQSKRYYLHRIKDAQTTLI